MSREDKEANEDKQAVAISYKRLIREVIECWRSI
jgi:hypothetical protein